MYFVPSLQSTGAVAFCLIRLVSLAGSMALLYMVLEGQHNIFVVAWHDMNRRPRHVGGRHVPGLPAADKEGLRSLLMSSADPNNEVRHGTV